MVIQETVQALFGKREAAARLGISVRSLESLMAAGKIGFVRVSNRAVRFRAEDVQRFIEERAVEPGPRGDGEPISAG